MSLLEIYWTQNVPKKCRYQNTKLLKWKNEIFGTAGSNYLSKVVMHKNLGRNLNCRNSNGVSLVICVQTYAQKSAEAKDYRFQTVTMKFETNHNRYFTRQLPTTISAHSLTSVKLCARRIFLGAWIVVSFITLKSLLALNFRSWKGGKQLFTHVLKIWKRNLENHKSESSIYEIFKVLVAHLIASFDPNTQFPRVKSCNNKHFFFIVSKCS